MEPGGGGTAPGAGSAHAPRRAESSLLRRLFSESAVYGLGGVGAQALGILLVPLYANALGSASYGVLAVLTTTLSLSSMVATLALPQTFFKWYFQESSTPAERAHVMGVTLGVRLAASVVGAAGLALLAIPLAVLLFGGRELPLLLLLVPVVLCDSLTSHPLSYLRAERRAGPYAALSFSRAVLGSGLAVILVLFAGLGVAGVVLGSLISSSAVLGASYAALGSRGAIRLAWDRRMATAMLAFSLPLLPASIAGWALNLSDRYVLQAFEGPATVGVYAVGYTIGLAINAVVLAPFSLAWGAAYWEIARGPHPERSFSRVMIGFLVLSSFAALGVSALATDLMRHLFRPEFEPGRFVVPFSAFGHVLSGVYVLGSAGLNLRSQTRWQPVLVVGAALANVVLNLTLVPPLGFMGAAVSTVVCYGLLGVVTTMVAQRYYPVPWDVPRSAGAVMVAAALTAAALLGPDHVVWRIACVAAYPALAIALRIVRRADLQAAASLIGRPPRR